MKTTDDKVGQTLALTNVARTLEYKGELAEACDLWQEVCVCLSVNICRMDYKTICT